MRAGPNGLPSSHPGRGTSRAQGSRRRDGPAHRGNGVVLVGLVLQHARHPGPDRAQRTRRIGQVQTSGAREHLGTLVQQVVEVGGVNAGTQRAAGGDRVLVRPEEVAVSTRAPNLGEGPRTTARTAAAVLRWWRRPRLWRPSVRPSCAASAAAAARRSRSGGGRSGPTWSQPRRRAKRRGGSGASPGRRVTPWPQMRRPWRSVCAQRQGLRIRGVRRQVARPQPDGLALRRLRLVDGAGAKQTCGMGSSGRRSPPARRAALHYPAGARPSTGRYPSSRAARSRSRRPAPPREVIEMIANPSSGAGSAPMAAAMKPAQSRGER
jgi:hypothetical protein